MNRKRRAMVVAIIGMAILGFGLIMPVEAKKPPLMPPDYHWYPGYPDVDLMYGRIWAGYVYDPTDPPWNMIYESDPSFVLTSWVYWEEELELFPQPINVHLWIKPADSGDDAWCEIKLSRHAVGHGNLEDWVDPTWMEFVVGPLYRWYVYFEPYYWDPGEYETHLQFTCKDPNNPKNKEMVVWDTLTGDPLDFWGMFLVQEV